MNIFEQYLSEIRELIYSEKDSLKLENIERAVCDFIAGMTDRYAINLYKKIK